MKKEKARIYYDEFGDLLELFVGGPTEGYYDETEDGLFVGRSRKTEEIIGFKLFAFKKRLEKILKYPTTRQKTCLNLL